MPVVKLTVSVKDYSKHSGIGERCIRELVNIPDFPALRVGRRIRIFAEQADKWIYDNRNKV